MTLKQFLKPDWRKILITVLISLAMLFSSSILACLGGVNGPQELSFPIISFPFYFYDVQLHNVFYSNCTSNFIPASLSVFYWYLLSCLIVWIYDKVKKKK